MAILKNKSILLLSLGLSIAAISCTKKEEQAQPTAASQQPQAQTQTQPAPGAIVNAPSTPDKLDVQDLVVGNGPEAVAGKTVTVHYTGTLTDGKEFDSSRKPGREPFKFLLGSGQVIPGWDKGVAGMKVGGKRKLVIPPELGYGKQGAGNVIPPDSTLVFEVELLGVG